MDRPATQERSPHVPPICAKLNMDPRALSWLQHTLSTELHALPTLSLFKPEKQTFCLHFADVESAKQVEGSSGLTQPRRPKSERNIWIPFSLPQHPPSRQVSTSKFEGFQNDHTHTPNLSSGL